MVLWLTGMSGAGKTTLAGLLELRFRSLGARVVVLDGDVMRANVNRGLGFSKEHRDENVRRLGTLCEMLTRNGLIVIVAAISPYRTTRDEVRSHLENFIEIHVDCPLDVLIQRDTKGLYKKAIAGEITHFTGISDPYEPPLSPEVTVCSATETVEQSLDKVWSRIQELLPLPVVPVPDRDL